MRSRVWTVVLILVALLSIGLTLLLVGLGDERPDPTAVPQPSAVPATEPAGPTASPIAPTVSPTPLLLVYVIREGDTLVSIASAHGVSVEELVAVNGLGDPNLIHPGQALVIPGHVAPVVEETPVPTADELPSSPVEPSTTPSATPLPPVAVPTLILSGPTSVQIASVLGSGDLEAEMVRLRNQGGVVVLQGWTLSDAAGHQFAFPRLVLFTGGEVVVHSGPGVSTATDLYWGRPEAAWESGVLIVLRDPGGTVMDTYLVP